MNLTPATIVNDEIDQGATFYRAAVLYDDPAQTILTDLTDKTPRATLMDMSGAAVAVFACALVDVDVKGVPVPGIGYALPRNVTAALDATLKYRFNLDLDDADGVTTDRKLAGIWTVKRGQPPPVVPA